MIAGAGYEGRPFGRTGGLWPANIITFPSEKDESVDLAVLHEVQILLLALRR